MLCWNYRSKLGSVDPLPTARMASPPASWGLAVGPALADGRVAAEGYAGLGDVEGGLGGEAHPGTLLLFQHGICKVNAGEGGNDLQRLNCHRPQLIKERCHLLGHTHGVRFCVHHMQLSCRQQERGDHQWED